MLHFFSLGCPCRECSELRERMRVVREHAAEVSMHQCQETIDLAKRELVKSVVEKLRPRMKS